MTSVAAAAATTPTTPAANPFGVQWYCPFEPTTATTTQNCMTFKRICTGASDAV